VNKELILKLIDGARANAENAYCPYTNVPEGCSVLVEDNMIFGGCNIESGDLVSGGGAGIVAIFKAISEGYTKFNAICFWCREKMPYPNGHTRQMLAEFCKNIQIIIANDETYSMLNFNDIFPFPPAGILAE
jgi:cytidine deaminase